MSDARDNDVATVSVDVLEEIQRRVLWLAVRIVDAANRDRDNGDGIKVGGHQASSASLVTAMTALWFAHLRAEDRVSVKPHASPVFHAIKYLLGDLDRSYLTTLRARGGLQSYPSRTKDPDGVDFSTGSVGLGAAAPLFAAAVRRYTDAHWPSHDRQSARFIALLGDAELDEGNVWEAIAEPATQGLGNVMWLVDFNRQSLDRVVPGVRIAQWRGQFEAAGWHVVEVKYGRRLREAPAPVRGWIDLMSNEQYQAMFGLTGPKLRDMFLDGAPAEVGQAVVDLPDEELAELVQDLGGHDLVAMLEAYAQCDAVTDRPSVVFAYTVKGYGLPIAGNPRNHSALLSGEQIGALRESAGLAGDDWARFEPGTPAGILCNRRREALRRTPVRTSLDVTVPAATGVRTARPVSTQDAFGKILADLSRDQKLAPYLVTTAPDVATSTNLAGFINRTGVFAPAERRAWNADPLLRWTEGPSGQHIELGISEMNLFLLLGQLGLAADLHDRPLLPVGTVYDPFVCRGLDAFIYSVYSGARFIVAGTPSGVTLAPEGGAHQSTVTASLGLELPNVTYVEPAYATALDWLLCDALGRIAAGPAETTTAVPAEDGAYYFRLTTRPLDQSPFEEARGRMGDAVLRRQVLAGAYLLHQSAVDGPPVYLVATGAVVPEALTAARELEDEGIAAHVVDLTSPDRLYTAWQRTLRQGVRTATMPSEAGALRAAFSAVAGDTARRAPVVTVHDAASHALAWIGSALGVPCVPLGVDEFGQSGSINELYELHDLLPGSIVNAALAALALTA
jgi:pyruvate dehydrogenase E1 component